MGPRSSKGARDQSTERGAEVLRRWYFYKCGPEHDRDSCTHMGEPRREVNGQAAPRDRYRAGRR